MKCKNCSMFEYCGLGGADGEKECTHPLFGKKPRRTEIDPMNNGEINQKEHTVLLLKMNKMQDTIDVLTDMIKELRAEMNPRYIGTAEACKILGVGRTVMMDRLKSGYYPFAFKDNSGHWRMSTVDLYRFQKQM